MAGYATWIEESPVRARAWREAIAARPASVAAMIDDKPATIEIVRRTSTLAPQTVRIDVFGSSTLERRLPQSAGFADVQRVLVLGTRAHATRPDFDVEYDDRFEWDNHVYRIVAVESGLLDRVEAVAEAET